MNTDEVIDMYFNVNVCRLCTREQNELSPLFDDNEDLPAKIKVLSPCLQMYAGDGLPNHVCEECISQVNSFCDFKLMVEASDCSLRDFIRRQQDRRNDQVMFIKEEDASSDDICTTSVVREVPTDNIFEEVEDPLLIKQEHDPVMVVDVAIQNLANNSSNSNNHNHHHQHHPAERGDVSVDQKPVSSFSHPNSDHLYECSTCTRKFSTSHGLKIHVKSHGERRGYECMICNKKFSTWQQFRGHRHTHTEGPGLGCRLCNKIFNTEKGLKVHCSRYHAFGKPYECSVCKKTYDTENSLKLHSRIHSEERCHICPVCNETFSSGLGLRLHSRTHTTRTTEVSQSSEGDSLTQHNNVTVSDFPCECCYCKKRFMTMKGLRGHQRCCKSKPPNEVTNMSTSSGQELPNETPVNQGCHKCPFCKRTFTEWRSLDHHLLSHKRIPWKCMKCMKSFRRRIGLKCHERLNPSCVTGSISAVNQVELHNDSQSVFRGTSDDSSRNESTLSADSLKTGSQCTVCKLFFRNARGLKTHKGRVHKQETQQTAVINNSDTPDTAEVNEDHLMQESVMHTVYQKTLKNVRHLRSHQWRYCRDDDSQLPSLNSSQKQVSEVTGSTVQGDCKDGQVQAQQHNCLVCCKSFYSEKGLLIHNSKLHRINCSENSAGNTSVGTVGVCDDNGKTDNQCRICDKKFDSNRALLIHSTKIHKVSSIEEVISLQESDDDLSGYYKCKICNEKYRKVKSFRLHCTRLQHMVQENVAQQVEDNNIGTYECPVCKRSFFSEQSYNRHNLKAHKGRIPERAISPQEAAVNGPSGYYECKVCNAKYKKVKCFRLHCTRLQHMVQENVAQQAEDSNVDTYDCTLCNRNYFSEHGYNCHRLKAHKGSIAEGVPSSEEVAVDGLLGCYECKVCKAKYKKVKSFRLHCTRLQHMVQENVAQQAEDDNVVTYDCSLCSRNFFSEHSYNRHSLHSHKGSIPKGVISSQETDNDGPLGYYECKVCNDKYKNVKSFRLHCTRLQHMVQENVVQQAEDNNIDTYKCPACNRTFFSEHSYNCHRLRNHKGLLHVTKDTTGVPSSTPQNIKNNLQSNSESGNCSKDSFSCILCRRRFNSAAGLKIHCTVQHSDASAVQKQMHGENLQIRNTLFSPPFKCCNMLFISEEGLKIHQRKYHKDYRLNEDSVRGSQIVCIGGGTEAGDYVCSFCDRTFLSENDLSMHYTRSHPERHSEDIVKNEMPLIHQSSELNFTNSTENQLYECSSCARSFSSEKGRRLHCRKMHEDINMFCSDINTDNQSVSLVNMNVASTTNSGLFPCSLCSSVFSNERSLKIHSTKNHNIQLLYNRSVEGGSRMINSEELSGTLCSVCMRTFGSEEALTLHFTKNHADSLMSKVIIPPFNAWQNVVC
ncbi:hypothetical protein B7P43_G04524, partial [Cryptotermes secundus]